MKTRTRQRSNLSIVVAVTGASGIVYARRLCRELARLKARAHLVMSEAGALVMKEELGVEVDLADGAGVVRALVGGEVKGFSYDHYMNRRIAKT